MIQKVVFFRYLPLTKKVYQDFYMKELMDAGLNVEYWYLPFILDTPKDVENYNNACVRILDSYKALTLKIRENDKRKTILLFTK